MGTNANKFKAALNQVMQARRNAESAALHASSGKFATGPLANPATKRARTRSAAKTKAIKEFQ
jgi:hypothetical protein